MKTFLTLKILKVYFNTQKLKDNIEVNKYRHTVSLVKATAKLSKVEGGGSCALIFP